MFIAVNAKADIAESKKGKLTPAQNAVVNAWSLSKQTGILNVLNDCTATASTPVANVVTVTFRKGFFTVWGRLVEVEEGTQIKITLPVSGTQKGYIVARFDLSKSGEEEFKVLTKTTNLIQQNLIYNPTGVYEFVLYEYTAYSAGSGNKLELSGRNESEYIDSAEYNLERIEDEFAQAKEETDAKIKNLENRLAEMGFKQGSVSGLAGATLNAMGKYAILTTPEFYISGATTKSVTMSFKSLKTFTANLGSKDTVLEYGPASATFSAGSEVVTFTSYKGYDILSTQLGFEISAYKDKNGNWVNV
jgi:hypothetical protein